MSPSRRKITIQLLTGSATVDAVAFGDWAAHEEFDSFHWTVTHLPTGANIRQAARGLTEAKAVTVARALGARAPRLERKSRDVSDFSVRVRNALRDIVAEALS